MTIPLLEQGTPYVLKKNGLYYAHNSRGYVGNVLLAELYIKEYATTYSKSHDDIQATPITDLLTDPDHVQQYIDRLEVIRDALTIAAKMTEKTQC